MHGKTKEFLVLLKNSREVHIYVYSKKERAKNPLVDLGYSKKRPSKLFKNLTTPRQKAKIFCNLQIRRRNHQELTNQEQQPDRGLTGSQEMGSNPGKSTGISSVQRRLPASRSRRRLTRLPAPDRPPAAGPRSA
jgi:hypothetical protein